MKRNINISNLRAFILIGNTPTLINKTGTYENYDLLATAQLIHKIMKDVFELNESDIVTFAYGKENDYKNLLEKTQRKIITQINQEEVLFQVPSDVSLYDYFETNESLLMMLRYKSTEKIKSDILLFLLDHCEKGFINDISYLMIYQAILEGKPNSLRIFNDCCYGGSIIPLIEAYSQLYNKSYSALRMNRKDTINLSFVKYYLSIIQTLDIDIFTSEIDWLSSYFENISFNQLSALQISLSIMNDLHINYNNFREVETNDQVSDIIQKFISDSKKQQVLISLASRSSITTSGQFMMSIVALYPLKCSNTESYLADIKSRINQHHTNIFYQICGGKNNISDGIKFLRFLKDVDFEQIHPPVHEHRIFSSAGYYSKAFTFSRIHITPNIKLYGGSPGTSEMFLEFFLRNTNSNIDFNRMEKNITTIKEGYKEYPVREKDQQQTYWMRLFPKHDSTENFRGDCFLSQVQKELKKKISAMRGIRTLACDNIENLINIFTSKRNEYQQDHQQLCTSKWLNVQKSHEKIDKEEWNEQTSISRIAENEVRQISSISLISALSIQLPFEDSLKIIFHILPQEQSVIVFISILISENIHQAGLFCIDVMTELSQIEDEILQRNGIIPTSASRTFIFNCSNKLRIMILSCISTIINLKCQNSIEMIISKIQNIDMIKFGNFINPILQEIELKINSEGINDKTIHQQIFEEFSQSIKLLKDKINQSVEIMKISLQKFKEMPIEINVNPEEKIINKTKEDKTLNEIIHKISGSSNFSHHAILLSIMNPSIHNESNISQQEIELISQKILEIRNETFENIHKIIENNIDVTIYEIIASNLIEIYSNDEFNEAIVRIIAYKLREKVLDIIFFPRNPRNIEIIESIIPNTPMKKNSLLIDTLNEILKIIRTPFMIDDDKFESDDNQSDKESKHHKRQEIEVEENEYHITNEDKEINQSLANIFRNHHPFLGIKAAIEIISSYYLKNDSINISIIKFIKEVINEVPKNFNITFTENDILQYIGLGNFGMEEIDQRRRGRLSKKKSQELEIYSENDLDIINFPIYEEDYSDEGIFKDYLDKSKISSNSDDENVYDDKPHISEEKIQKYRKKILGNIHDCYTKEVWIVFKELFSKRVKKAFGDKINLDYPTDLGIGEGKRFLTSFQELSKIVPLTYINDFWVFKLNLGEYLVTHFEDKSIKIMIQSFDDADRIVTPRHFGGIKKRYSEGPPMI